MMDRFKYVSATEVDRVCCYKKLLDRICKLAWLMDIKGQIYAYNHFGKTIRVYQTHMLFRMYSRSK